jgi:hypothetical protein
VKKIHIVLLFYTALFLLVYLLALNVNYVEGDDATTVLYHLCGRNAQIQPPYAAYNSGFDFLLRAAGNPETSLRHVAVLASFIGGWLSLCLVALLIDGLASDKPARMRFGFLLALPFLIPDFIFHSLIVNSVNISFAFALAGLILFVRFWSDKRWWVFLVSALLLGLAIPFRWSMLTIFPVFYAIVIYRNRGSLFRALAVTALHSALALCLGIFFIYLSGYGPKAIVSTIFWGRNFMSASDRSVTGLVATGSAFFTIPFLLVLAVGFARRKTVREWLRFAALLLLPAMPYFVLGFFPSFKYMISVVPVLLLIALDGYASVCGNRYLRTAFYLSIIGIWLVGIRVYATGTTAGPGFGQTIEGKVTQSEINEKNADRRVHVKSAAPTFGGGFYMPTPEGPRPLFGYFSVIFGGGWKGEIQAFTDERDADFDLIGRDPRPMLLQDRRTAFMQCDLFRRGYVAGKPFQPDAKTGFEYRDFVGPEDTIRLYVIPDGVPKNEVARQFIREHHGVLLRSSYSSTTLSVMQTEKDLKIIGPYSVFKK